MSQRPLVASALAATLAATAVPVIAAGISVGSKSLTTYRSCVLRGYTPTSPPTTTEEDSYVAQGSATSNFGTSSTLSVQTGASSNKRAYVIFSLGSCPRAIPSSAIVRQATLELYASTLPTSCRAYDVFRVTSTWTESALTWNNQPFGTTINNPASTSRSATFSLGPAGCQISAAGYAAATVTTDVQSFVSGSASNFGWMVRDDSEGSSPSASAAFGANNLNSVTESPLLVVTYVDVA